MEWISSWIQGIIIAVIISTIIEMILPEGNSKKYIKVVIGVYILFSMVSPVITKITGNNFRVSDIFDLDEYIEVSKNNGSVQNQLETQNQDQIRELYLSSIKNDIKEKVQNRGYDVTNLEIKVENDESYTLKEIKLQVKKQKEKSNEENSENDINQIASVNDITIAIYNTESSSQNNQTNNSSSSNSDKKNKLSSQEQKELKEYLISVYEINIKNIHINE